MKSPISQLGILQAARCQYPSACCCYCLFVNLVYQYSVYQIYELQYFYERYLRAVATGLYSTERV